MEALKGSKNSLQVVRFDADTVIVHGKLYHARALSRRHMDAWRRFRLAVFNRVADQILKEQRQR